MEDNNYKVTLHVELYVKADSKAKACVSAVQTVLKPLDRSTKVSWISCEETKDGPDKK